MSTYGLDDKKILKLETGGTTLTIFPDGVTNDIVAIEPDLPTSTDAGDIVYRDSGTGQLKSVTTAAPITWANGVLGSAGQGHSATDTAVAGVVDAMRPTVVTTNFTLATVAGGNTGGNRITRAAPSASFLPGGDWTALGASTNNLPVACDGFQFLAVNANMLAAGGANPQVVYVPCYYVLP